MNYFIQYFILSGLIIAIMGLYITRRANGFITIVDFIYAGLSFFVGFFILPTIFLYRLYIITENTIMNYDTIRFFEVKEETVTTSYVYDPNAICNVTPALKQSECGTTCCTPNEVK